MSPNTIAGKNEQSQESVCEECEAQMHLRQSWTGNPYHICPNCN